MKDFKTFLAKVLEPAEGRTANQSAQNDSAPRGATPDPQQKVPAKELERRYVEAMNALSADATENDGLVVFVDVLAWKLAAVAHQWGPMAAGDMLHRFGGYLTEFTEQAGAQREADKAKAAGQLPH